MLYLADLKQQSVSLYNDQRILLLGPAKYLNSLPMKFHLPINSAKELDSTIGHPSGQVSKSINSISAISRQEWQLLHEGSFRLFRVAVVSGCDVWAFDHKFTNRTDWHQPGIV